MRWYQARGKEDRLINNRHVQSSYLHSRILVLRLISVNCFLFLSQASPALRSPVVTIHNCAKLHLQSSLLESYIWWEGNSVMPARAIIPAAVITAPTPERQHFVQDSYPHSSRAGPSRTVTYGAVSSLESSPGSRKGKEPAPLQLHDEEYDRFEIESCDSGVESLVDSEFLPIQASFGVKTE